MSEVHGRLSDVNVSQKKEDVPDFVMSEKDENEARGVIKASLIINKAVEAM